MREQRQNLVNQLALEEQRLRASERDSKEGLMLAKKKLESENERRQAANRMHELEISTKESQIENARELANQEKQSLEQDMRESYIREIQAKQIDIEARKKGIVEGENEMRRQQRLLEKKQELINTDHEQLQERILQFNSERLVFEELAAKIQDTSERLAEEREKVLEQKAVFDEEKETLDRFKHDIDVERSVLQSEFFKAEELEHELTHRENMLKMLQFNQDRQAKGIINIPSYSSCPGLKHGAQPTFNVQSSE